MPLLMQSKLLRVLQEREFNKIGSNEKINFNARIISATNIDYNQTKAAEELGISRKKLITKIKRYNL